MVRFSASVIRSSSNHLKTGGENILHPTPLTQTLVHSISKTRADATLCYKAESRITTLCGYVFTLTSDRFETGNTWKVLTPPATGSEGNKYAFEGIVISAPVSLDPSLIYLYSRTAPFAFRDTLSVWTTEPHTAALRLLGARGRQKRWRVVGPVYRERNLHLWKASSCSSQRHRTYRSHPLQHRRKSDVAGQVRRGCASGLSSPLLSIPIVSGPSQL